MGPGEEVWQCQGVGGGARRGAEVEVRWSRGIGVGAHQDADGLLWWRGYRRSDMRRLIAGARSRHDSGGATAQRRHWQEGWRTEVRDGVGWAELLEREMEPLCRRGGWVESSRDEAHGIGLQLLFFVFYALLRHLYLFFNCLSH